MSLGYIFIIFAALGVFTAHAFGPRYPVTAAWFKDRFTEKEWLDSLKDFQDIGGDTVWLRAPQVVIRDRASLERDPSFVWCGSTNSSTGVSGKRCYDEAVEELDNLGLKVATFLTYNYEENFSDGIMLCPKYDRKIKSSRVYYRIVLPLVKLEQSCEFPRNTPVVVLFTSFSGTDPHELLVSAATKKGVDVYFGLPSFPDQSGSGFVKELAEAYYAWIFRVLVEHRDRYNAMPINKTNSSNTQYDTIKGYYSTDEVCLGQVTLDSFYVNFYKRLAKLVHPILKLFTISPFVDLNRSQINLTKEQHVRGFEILAQTGVDVIAVQEGRGAGKGCYYWETEIDKSVREIDPVLDKVIHYIAPTIKHGVTYREAFTASNQEVFRAFAESRDNMFKHGIKFQFWLNVEAFEYLRDDPCLPVDIPGSGMAELLDRTNKSRIDRALTVAGSFVQKVISFAWDSDYVCVTKNYTESLSQTIREDFARPIISNCSFHNADNMSIVVIGYSMDALMQTYEIDYPTKDGKRHQCELYGYYFEIDYGAHHARVPSLQYIQMFDIPEVYTDLALKGYIQVKAKGSYNKCVFKYDYS